MSHFIVNQNTNFARSDEEDHRKAHGWVFPPSPVTRGVLVGMTDVLAEEIIEIIREDCTDEHGNMVMEGNAPELMQFAARLEHNLAQKAMRKMSRV